ncbi:UNVERIFIED_CONTAM: hypothetical protein Sindi_0757200 [Sesamum indicum]
MMLPPYSIGKEEVLAECLLVQLKVMMLGVDIASPFTVYSPQDYHVPQSPQDYYMSQSPQNDWFQSAPYIPTQIEDYFSRVHLNLGLGINQPCAPGYNISPISYISFSAYHDNVESSSATTSSRLDINPSGDDNEAQN